MSGKLNCAVGLYKGCARPPYRHGRTPGDDRCALRSSLFLSTSAPPAARCAPRPAAKAAPAPAAACPVVHRRAVPRASRRQRPLIRWKGSVNAELVAMAKASYRCEDNQAAIAIAKSAQSEGKRRDERGGRRFASSRPSLQRRRTLQVGAVGHHASRPPKLTSTATSTTSTRRSTCRRAQGYENEFGD
jgi:hypothetical protein